MDESAVVGCTASTAVDLGKIKPRHYRQVSDVTVPIHADSTYSVTSKSTMPFCRRWCLCCRQTMWTNKFWMGFTASTWGFLSSIERAVILPTLWLYLKEYWGADVANTDYGTTVAAFSLSILIMTPIYGLAAYSGVRVKTLLLIANLLEIIGNLIYLFAPAPSAVILGRLISGIGASCEPPLYADIVRATNRDERTTYIIVLLLTRQIGLIFGPSFTLVMAKMNYRVANFTLNVYNGPGLLMAILWLLHSFIILLSYPNVDKNGRVIYNDSQRSCCHRENWIQSNEQVKEESRPMLSDSSDSLNSGRLNTTVINNSIRPYLSFNIIALYCVNFAAYFSFMSLEAALPPVANRIFNWTEVETSYVYLGASILIIFVVILLRILNQFYTDRVLLLAGLITMVISYLWLTIVAYLLPEIPINMAIPLTLTGIAIHVIGLPFSYAYSESLYTKLAPVSDMDRAQSIFRTVINVAFLLGPYVGGSLIGYPTLVFLCMLLLSIFPTLLVACRFKDFIVNDRPSSPSELEIAKES
ncbi:Major facilitator superfamily domain-containing protein [Schistosoma japonicum]|uniref:Major facilitator superfamily n=3 Tax=Schistosoma japonicum TaxID=6182 RepID=C1LIB5_SCHJA|nr:Major facilitator superfamily domain-containing protein [Schistosoma japonicum]CAX74443.1 Major facilitator superfamily [Schistosoma japonicum]